MEYSIGDKIKARINKILDNGCYCSFFPLNQNQFGFMPKYLMLSLYDENGNFIKKVGDNIVVVINRVTDKGIILSDVATYEKEEAKAKNQMLIDYFVSKYERGTIFEAEVVKVQHEETIININGIQGIIKKEDANWNEIDKIENLFFEGETIDAVFIKHENNQLYFSFKHLNEKPYEEKLYDFSLEDLLKFAGHNMNVFIGQAKQYSYGLFIENLYSANENQEGKLLIDPIFGYNLRAIVSNANFNVEENKFYKVTLDLLSKNIRLEQNQLFQFSAIIIKETKNPYKADVDLTFEKFTSPAGNVATAHLLAEVGKNMYSSKDRMFFELVQNADDAASKKGVLINVKTNGDYLIVKHNGNSFDKDDFEAITSAANGTKKANENKTGYKGIGFKSVFTDSEDVFIKTGGYQFKFDKSDTRFTNFESFYFLVNRLKTEDEKQFFLQKYNSEYVRFRGVVDIPWQLEPIWVDSFPEELGEDFTASNVAIALRLGENKIDGDNGYSQAIYDIISNPKFMLFLRNTKRIDFNGRHVSKATKGGVITLKNSFNTNRIEYFKREDFEIKVNNTVFEENGIGVRIKIDEQDEVSGKIIEAKFVDIHNQEMENIPKKIAINNSTAISFAIPISENGELKPDTTCTEVSMFAFLPTLVKDFKFPFYINANFILDPPRQRILGDNPWNFYLMQEIARCLVRWCASLNDKQDKNALNILISQYFDEGSTDTKQLAIHFNTAYKSALESDAFILNHKDELSKQDEIIIDKTDLYDIIGADLLCKIIGTNKSLPSDKIDSSILEEKIFEKVEALKFDDVVNAISNNEDFNGWFRSANEEQKGWLYKWIDDNNTSSKTDTLKTFVLNLPLFQFGEEYKSYENIDFPNSIITTNHIIPIKNILTKLNFKCSNNIFDENHPLFGFIEAQNEEDLFKSIKEANFGSLDIDERKSLFLALKDFYGVGEVKFKEIALFRNMNGEFKPLGEMAVGDTTCPIWLNSFLIDKKEYFSEIQRYLIQNENIFQEIVQSQYTSFEKIPITELYSQFREQWTSTFTKTLIDKYGATDALLNIVELTDGAKHYFLDNFGRIDLNSATTRDSVEYKVVRLALSSNYDVVKLKELIYIDNCNLSQFTVSDDILITISGKEYHFSLSEILPNQFEYGSFNRIKELLSDIQGNVILFSLSRMADNNVINQLKELRTPAQYVFYVCYNVANNRHYSIQITDEQFVSNVLSYCFENKIDILSRYIQHFTNQRIIGEFINADDVTIEEERLSPIIRKWANNEEKEKFLISLGVKGALSDEIKRRKAFINDAPISLPYSNDIKSEITAFLNWCITLETPYTKDNQVKILKEMFTRLNISTYFYMEDFLDAKEWNDNRYTEFVKSKLPIFCIESEMPRRGIYQNVHLYTEYVGDYVCLRLNPDTLYINTKNKNIETVLLSVCDDKNILFTKEDWTKLFMVSVETLNEKEDELAQKEKTIKSLSEENSKKESLINEQKALLEKYRTRYGDLKDIESDVEEVKNVNSEFVNELHKNAQEEIHAQSRQDVIERDGLSTEEQIAAHKEAEQIVREKLEADGYDCSNWIMEESDSENKFKKWHSVNQVENIINPNGKWINLVIKSAKGGYIYLSATDFEFLTSSSNNVLMVWDGKNVHSVTAEDIFNKDSNVNLIFDTEYTPKHYYAALSKVFQFVKRTTFAVKNPNYNAYDTIKSFGMDSRTEGVQDLFDDNDL